MGIKEKEFNLEKEIWKKNKGTSVFCSYCGEFLGWRKKLRYNIGEGTIQEGRGRKRPYRTFCSKKCQKKYHEILDRLKKNDVRIDKLEKLTKSNGNI